MYVLAFHVYMRHPCMAALRILILIVLLPSQPIQHAAFREPRCFLLHPSTRFTLHQFPPKNNSPHIHLSTARLNGFIRICSKTRRRLSSVESFASCSNTPPKKCEMESKILFQYWWKLGVVLVLVVASVYFEFEDYLGVRREG